MSKISQLFNRPADVRLHKPSSFWTLPNQLIGLEFEFEMVGRGWPEVHELDRYYIVKEDGSLRDNGLEFVFQTPLMGEDLTKAIDLMSKWSDKWVCNERTGFHVHLDCRDLEQVNIYRLFLLYAFFEYLIYKFIGDNRHKSNFCVPWYRTYEQHGIMSRILKAKSYGEVASSVENASRYMGLNLASLFKFGSLEFRQMQNTHDFKRIVTWINIIMQLKQAAEASALIGDELLEEINSRGPVQWAEQYMPLLYQSIGQDKEDWAFWLNRGLEVCQELCISTAPKEYFNNSINTLISKSSGTSQGLDLFLNSLKRIKN